ncbi:hypothetical protein BZA77DRAFT_306062 [Pyronema omphalodes]|nr:hypothetical protein BZA77DRAFT_306062 [Pyronema omphalodes]
MPKISYTIQDSGSAGAKAFVKCFPDIHAVLVGRIEEVNAMLYGSSFPLGQWGPHNLNSFHLHVRPFEGVAYTSNHRETGESEIYLSTTYIRKYVQNHDPEPNEPDNFELVRNELLGVLSHEIVHVFQNHGNAPPGLIEGIADYFRLKMALPAQHWKRGGTKWDDGYQITAYFLEWVEGYVSEPGFVQRLNKRLGEEDGYTEKIWEELGCGCSVEELWRMYAEKYGLN